MSEEIKKLSLFIKKAVPDYVIEDSPQFALFIEKYFEYLERDFGEFDLAVNLLKYLDIDTTVDEFLPEFKKLYAPGLPENLISDFRLIIKNIRSFYNNKGNEESYKFLFKALFNQDLEFYYPKVDILRCSDGRWIEPYYLITSIPTFEEANAFKDKFIVGSVSGAKGYVNLIAQFEDPLIPGEYRYTFSVTNREGVFVDTDIITEQGETTPEVTLVEDGVVAGEGRWEGTEGFLSWNKYLQDSYYYQDFSYELQSDLSVEAYDRIIKELVHPAGTMMFGSVIRPDADLIELHPDGINTYMYYIITWINTVLAAGVQSVAEDMGIASTNSLTIEDQTYLELQSSREFRNNLSFWVIGDLEQIAIEEFDRIEEEDGLLHYSPMSRIEL